LRLTIVIATHRRPLSLAALLKSLAPQLRPELHQLIIAENGSPAPSPLVSLPLNPVHLYDPKPGKCRVQNQAIELATAPIVIFLDDDLAVAPGYLEAVERFFTDYPEFSAMKGRILPERDPWAIVGEKASYLDLPLVDHGPDVVEVHGMIGANMAIRTEVVRQLGGFDERLGPGAAGHEEETEMSARIRRAGGRIGYCPTAVAIHEVDPERADRERFLRVARERGYCRTLHEHHRLAAVTFDLVFAQIRLALARAVGASLARLAREEKRFAIATGMYSGLKAQAYLNVARERPKAPSINERSRLP
jgi:GT2 family glycosyltransferase